MARPRFEIVLAETAGFCMGVRRAVRMALSAADAPATPLPIRTHGPLIHNRQVLQVLADRGVTVLEGKGDGGTVVIRAHGLSREERERLASCTDQLLDATCPHVRRLQDIVDRHARQGYACIIVGDAGHAEVEGALSYAGGAGYVVSGPGEVDDLPDLDRVVVVAQTTQDERLFRETVERVRERYGECLAFETICRSTEQRQAEVRALAEQVDAMIVVGGFNSANTKRLADISRACGLPTYHVETERELDVDEVLQHSRIGLTAGASTPTWMVRKVVRRLEDEHRRRSAPLRSVALGLLRAVVDASLYGAAGAAVLTLVCSRLLRQPPRLVGVCAAVSFAFVLSQQLLNRHGRRDSLYLSEPDRAEFYLANGGRVLALAVAASAVALFLSWFLGTPALGLVFLGTGSGLLYRFKFPRTLGLGVRSLDSIPGSKEIFVGLAWGTMAGLVPAVAAQPSAPDWRGAFVAFGAASLLAFQRTLALDLRAVQADQLVGRETLAHALGARTAERVFMAQVALFAAVVGLLGLVAGWATSYCMPMLVAVPYSLFYAAVLRRPLRGEWAELLVDGLFPVLGAAALAWSYLQAG